jgi:hypothetical protein
MILMLAGGLAAGCGSQPATPTADAPIYNSLDELKQRLGEVAQNGDGGSSLMGLSESVEKLKATEPKKAEMLAKGVGQLENAGTAAQRKAIAAKMLKEL